MNCIAIDDEPLALEVVKNHASKIPYLTLKASFVNAMEALQYLQKEETDLIFLDIHMPDITGLQFIKSLLNKPLIIFTTAYSQYALESYDVSAIDYLLKPFEFERFLMAVNRAKKQFDVENKPENANDRTYFFIKTGYDYVKLQYEEIEYLESAGNYMSFVTIDKKKILSRMNMKETLELLPSKLFVQIHKSYVISVLHVKGVVDNHVVIRDKRIPIGPSFQEVFYKFIANK